MTTFSFRFIVALLTFLIGVSAVGLWFLRRSQPSGGAKDLAVNTSTQASKATMDRKPEALYPTIRSVDFANFTYSGGSLEYYEDLFTLRDGKDGDWRYGMTLKEIIYGDVTGDDSDEAINNLNEETEGSQGVNAVYIYTLDDQRLKLLWSFESGDRGNGGLSRIYPKDGGLVVELYGKDTHIGENLNSSDFVGICCAKSITRTYYEWRGSRFERVGESGTLPNRDFHGRQ